MANPVLTVNDVFGDVGRVLGITDSATIYSRLNDIVEILSTESDWDPTRGYVDVCVGCNGQVTLPPEVDVVLAVNVNGRPTQMHDFWFMFHLNGPGEHFWEADTGWGWLGRFGRSSHVHDGLYVSVFQDPFPQGCPLTVQLESSVDSNCPMWVYGFDQNGVWIRSEVNGLPVDGFALNTAYGQNIVSTQQVSVITRISFQNTTRTGYVALYGVNTDGSTFLMGNYAPGELEPRYRRIVLSKPCVTARIAFKRRTQTLSQLTDLIFLHSKYAIVTMAKALKKIDQDRLQEAEMYQNMAISFLKKKQLSVSVPAGPSIQMADNNLIADKYDRLE